MPTPSRAHSVERAMLFVCISRNSKFQAEPLSLSLSKKEKNSVEIRHGILAMQQSDVQIHSPKQITCGLVDQLPLTIESKKGENAS